MRCEWGKCRARATEQTILRDLARPMNHCAFHAEMIRAAHGALVMRGPGLVRFGEGPKVRADEGLLA